MAIDKIEWIIVRNYRQKPLGAVGFIGGKFVTAAAFYDDKDLNEDGSVSIVERVQTMIASQKYRSLATVVTNAALMADEIPDLDPIIELDVTMTKRYFGAAVLDGMYAVYLSPGVGSIAKAVAGNLVAGAVKQYLVTKGMEAAVKQYFRANVI
ncbi:hypothetical protein HB779_16185 [Phyllobacterium sp. 628]|uniref:hypothetical protein n=1 Tax=Phyllobacterium sp. 628 TaxID=2718938 RepID=UPI00166221AE|nr:hypothetical protein [Phyllobacterium sp. 628]QND53260.1 hypothetical protein HB779_16185 [Phyllobacterium sp. 628]